MGSHKKLPKTSRNFSEERELVLVAGFAFAGAGELGLALVAELALFEVRQDLPRAADHAVSTAEMRCCMVMWHSPLWLDWAARTPAGSSPANPGPRAAAPYPPDKEKTGTPPPSSENSTRLIASFPETGELAARKKPPRCGRAQAPARRRNT